MAIPRHGVDKHRDALVSRYGQNSPVVKAYDVQRGYITKSAAGNPLATAAIARKGGFFDNPKPGNNPLVRAPIARTRGPFDSPAPASSQTSVMLKNNPLITAATMPGGSLFDNATPVTPPAGTHDEASTRATQTFLKNKGYNIAVDGKWGPQTQSAALNWRNTRSPVTWNRSANATPSTLVPAASAAAASAPASAGVTANTAPPAALADVGAAARVPAAHSTGAPQAGGLVVPGYTPIPLSEANRVGAAIPIGEVPGASPMDPNQVRSELAQAYAGKIQAIQNMLGTVAPDTAQHLADIHNWFGQVQGSLGTAQGQADAGGKEAAASIGKATEGIVNSLGGSANLGSGSVGAEGASQAGYASQLGQIESGFLGSMAPILKLAEGGAATAEQARMQRIAMDYQNQLLDAQSQEKSDMFDKLFQVQQYNAGLQQQQFGNKMSVQQYNNQLAQQREANRLGIMQTNQAGAHQTWADKLALEGLNLQKNQFNLTAADTASTINARQAAVQQNAVDSAIRLRQSQIQAAAQRAVAEGRLSETQSKAYSTAVSDTSAQFGVTPDWKVPAGVDPKAIVTALSGRIPGKMTQQKKQMMKAVLSQYKTQTGGRLFPDAVLNTWWK